MNFSVKMTHKSGTGNRSSMAHKVLMMIQTAILDTNPPVWPVGLYPGPRAPSSRPSSRAGTVDSEGDSKVLSQVLGEAPSSNGFYYPLRSFNQLMTSLNIIPSCVRQ